ncbi:hypothetical protein [Leptobacterium sp. I13]|uniref:hypothetical protein n=1 Tax=Leptobacterium meishanense TaxID=3128904 RepID=UPI0030EC5A98
MRTFFLQNFLLAIILVSSCKRKEPKNNIIEKPKEILEVTINLKANKKDIFRIELNNIRIDEFQKMNIQVFEEVPVSTNYETINVNFFDGMISNNLVFNLGNKEEKTIDISSIEITNGVRHIKIAPKQIPNYFRLNKFVEFDSISNKIITKKSGNKLNPKLVAKQGLINKISPERYFY